MTDAEYVLDQLRAGPRDAMQIISASIRDRGVGLTVHSRAASLRKAGYVITCAIEGKTRKGRERYVYRLVSEPNSLQRRETRVPPTRSAVVGTGADSLGDAGVVDPPARVDAEPQRIPPAVAPLDAAPEQLVLA